MRSKVASGALACVALGLASAGLAGCDDGGGDAAPGAPFGLATRETVEGVTLPEDPLAPAPVALVDAFPLLTFELPVGVTHAGDGSDRLFVVELGGRIRVFPNDVGASAAPVFLDLSARVFRSGEAGLLGLAFDPAYATNGFLYVNYAAPPTTPGTSHRTLVSRFSVTADPDVADPASEVVLLAFDQPFWNHNAGSLAFGPDGMLYVASGDGGSHDDPSGVAQDLGSPLGKILRIAPDGSVPADNPFVGVSGARPEVWAFGLRNPWRIAFDRLTGALWAGDVGQNAREEIDLVARGGNYGWDLFEASLDHENPAHVPLAATVAPVHEYGRGQGTSVTGGTVYRGAALPDLEGAYVFADYNSGRVWALVHDGSEVVSHVQIATATSPTAFGEDEAGELYLTSIEGRVWRLEEAPGAAREDFPALLSQTGLFADLAALAPAPGLVEYDVNVPLWSDGARKRRWIALPGDERVGFSAEGPWSFPTGTALVKHFEAPLAGGGTRRLETRVLLRTPRSWAGVSYRWNAQETDAERVDVAASEVLAVDDPDQPGTSVALAWTFPGRDDCAACHTPASGRVLGLRTEQLNRDFAYPLATDNQLRAWDHVRLFTPRLEPAASYAAWPALDDAGAPVAARARAWLAASCAHCHRPGGPTPVALDLRFATPDAALGALDAPPEAGGLGLPDAAIVRPGAKESSVLWERLRRLDAARMPPVGSALVASEAVALVGAWIDGLAP